MKPSGVAFMENRFPLIEKLMSRDDCQRWLWEHYRRIAPKSACKQCPYQETERLHRLKQNNPDEWQELVDFDAQLRTPKNIARFHGELYVHRSCQPLVQIDFSAWLNDPRQGQLFANECEGMCGV